MDTSNFDNEETLQSNAQHEGTQANNNTQKGNNGWQKVVVGGVSGIMLGAGGAYAATTYFGHHGEAKGDHANTDSSAHSAHQDTNIDDVSFKDAFNTARAASGPNGVFEWHGHAYSTATESEWNAAHVNDHVVDNGAVHHPVDPVVHPEPQPTPEPQPDPQPNPSPSSDVFSDINHSDVQVLGVQQGEIDGQEMTMATANIDGHASLVIDVDQDDTFDYVVSDMNHDQQIQDNEMFDIHDQGVSVSHFQQLANEGGTSEDGNSGDVHYADHDNSDQIHHDDNYLADGPDYIDHADVHDYSTDV